MSDVSVGSQDVPPLRMACHANRHVAKFLTIPYSHRPPMEAEEEDGERVHERAESEAPTACHTIQVIRDGRQLTADRLLDPHSALNLRQPILVEDSAQSIGMKVPTNKESQPVTVRDVADLIGHHHPVSVIDVEHQEEKEEWSLGDLVVYFECETRLKQTSRLLGASEANPVDPSRMPPASSQGVRSQRKAAAKFIQHTNQQCPPVLNQISLEFSETPLRDKVLSPRFVREMDWIDIAWPRNKRNAHGSLEPRGEDKTAYPRVQYYCLTSAAGCYTDFHLDFGGTSVWYHVLSGEKDFCLIPPTKENLAVYEDWLCRPNQADIFLPDIIPNPETNVIRVSLKEAQTLVIPTAWIHAVYTPKDSLVIGGNFLHGVDIPLQLAVHCLECRTRVQEKFRFPHFLPINFYAGGFYLDKLRRGAISKLEVDGLEVLIDALDEWWKVHKHSQSMLQSGPTVANAAIESARWNQCTTVEAFLQELRNEHRRVVQGGIAPNPKAIHQTGSTDVVTPWPTEAPLSLGKAKLRLSLKMALQPSSPGPDAVISKDLPSSSNGGATNLRLSNGGGAKVRLSLKGKTDSQTVAPKTEVEDRIQDVRKMGLEMEKGPESNSPTKFRITVSSSKMPRPILVKPKRPREDSEWIDDSAPLEDEWIPSSNANRRTKNVVAKAATVRSGAKPSTSRERLMKRFR